MRLIASPRRCGGREVRRRREARDEEQRLADAEEQAHDDQQLDAVGDQVPERRRDRDHGAGDERDPPAPPIGEAAGERPHDSDDDRERAEHDPDREVVAAEGSDREPRHDRQEDGAGDEEREHRRATARGTSAS